MLLLNKLWIGLTTFNLFALTILMLKYCDAETTTAKMNNNALEMYTDIFETIIHGLKKDFIKHGIEFNSEVLAHLFVLLFFQQTGNLAMCNVDDVIARMSFYDDVKIVASSLQPQIFKASNGKLPDKELLRESRSIPLEWTVKILQEEPQMQS